jgi:hypothetical protein
MFGWFSGLGGLTLLLVLVSLWFIMEKANEPGWAGVIPLFHVFMVIKITGKPIWWFVLFLIPPITLVMVVLIGISLAKSFGRGVIFGLLLCAFPQILMPWLAFGPWRFVGPSR